MGLLGTGAFDYRHKLRALAEHSAFGVRIWQGNHGRNWVTVSSHYDGAVIYILDVLG